MFTMLLLVLWMSAGIVGLSFTLVLDIFSVPIIIFSIYYLIKHKKGSSKTNKNSIDAVKRFVELSKKATEHTLLWDEITTPNLSLYQTHFHEWDVEIWEEKGQRIMVVRQGVEAILKVVYQPEFDTFLSVRKDERWIRKMKNIYPSQHIEQVIENLIHQVTKATWQQNKREEISEEVMMKELNDWIIEHQTTTLMKEYKKFQQTYIEHFRYELHMNEEEMRAWKDSLKVLHQVAKRSQPVIFTEVLKKTNAFIEQHYERLRREYLKSEQAQEHAFDWHQMEQNFGTWNPEEKSKYLYYKANMESLFKGNALKIEEQEQLKRAWEELFQVTEDNTVRLEKINDCLELTKQFQKNKEQLRIHWNE